MSLVVMHNVVSVDGYIADEADQVGPLFDWYFNGDTALTEGGGFKVSQASAAYVRPMWDSIGSMVIGRHLFDLTNGWEGTPPAGEHVVVVSHRPRPDGWHPEASYHFTADVAQAVASDQDQQVVGDSGAQDQGDRRQQHARQRHQGVEPERDPD